MTRDEVQAAKAALEAEGQTPSYNAVLARLGHGSKRDVMRFMQQLNGLESAAVAVEEPEAAPSGTLDPRSPLDQALQAAQQAAGAVPRLERRHQALEAERQRLDNEILTQEARRPSRRSVAALERQRTLTALQAQRAEVEARRQAVAEDAEEAHHGARLAAGRARESQAQARRWVRALHKHQRDAAPLVDPWRQDVLAEARAAQQQLAALIGAVQAQALADDPRLQPAWLRE